MKEAISGLGKEDRKRLSAIFRKTKGTISVSDAVSILKVSPVDTAKMLSRWAKKGWLSRVRRGLYIRIPLESSTADIPVDDPWILADRLFSPCYIGGWSAAEYWDLTEQVFRTIVVLTIQKPRDRAPVIKGSKVNNTMEVMGTRKLDLTDDEVLVLDPVSREVHHPYSDRPDDGIHVQCYSFEEIFAEKIRALAERLRPRDLYDVIHLYRHDSTKLSRNAILSTLEKKCAFKGISVPTIESLESKPERAELETEWENMLGHQVPALPPFDQFWQELPEIFEWLYRAIVKPAPSAIPVMGQSVDVSWQPPAMAEAWHTAAPLELIRFAAANRLCVRLNYVDADGNRKQPLIEPYSLRRTRDGNLLLYAVKHEAQQDRSYRVDRMRSAEVTKIRLHQNMPLN